MSPNYTENCIKRYGLTNVPLSIAPARECLTGDGIVVAVGRFVQYVRHNGVSAQANDCGDSHAKKRAEGLDTPMLPAFTGEDGCVLRLATVEGAGRIEGAATAVFADLDVGAVVQDERDGGGRCP